MMRAQPYEIDGDLPPNPPQQQQPSSSSQAPMRHGHHAPLGPRGFGSITIPSSSRGSGGVSPPRGIGPNGTYPSYGQQHLQQYQQQQQRPSGPQSPSQYQSSMSALAAVQHNPSSSSTLKDLLALDTVAVRQAEDRQIVEDHYLIEMKRAVAQANKADADCDDARRRIKQLKAMLEAVQHKRDSTAAIVADCKARLDAMMGSVEDSKAEITAMDARKARAAERASAEEEERRRQVASSIGTVGGVDVTALEALRYEVESEERRVMSLRQRHVDSHQLAKDVRSDLEMLQSRLQIAETKRAALETNKLQLAALEANSGYRDAHLSFNSYGELMEKTQWQLKEIAATRIEGQSMVLHLMEGAKSRNEAINKERRRLIGQYVDKFGPLSAETQTTVEDLITANSARRAEMVNLIVSSAAEKEAMEQYVGVLSERCSSLLKQLREVEGK